MRYCFSELSSSLSPAPSEALSYFHFAVAEGSRAWCIACDSWKHERRIDDVVVVVVVGANVRQEDNRMGHKYSVFFCRFIIFIANENQNKKKNNSCDELESSSASEFSSCFLNRASGASRMKTSKTEYGLGPKRILEINKTIRRRVLLLFPIVGIRWYASNRRRPVIMSPCARLSLNLWGSERIFAHQN